MYQFMVTTTRSGASLVSSRAANASSSTTSSSEVSRMSFTSRTNKWASRAVIVLQLAAWSAVGIVLVEKGVTSLQRSKLRNDDSIITDISQRKISRTGGTSESTVGSDDLLSVIPLVSVDATNGPSTTAVLNYSGSLDDSATSSKINSTRSHTTEVPMGHDNDPGTKPELVSRETIGSVQPDDGQMKITSKTHNFKINDDKNDQSNRSKEIDRRIGSNETNKKNFDDESARYNKTKLVKAFSTSFRNYDDDVPNVETTLPSMVTTKEVIKNSNNASGWSSIGRKRLRIAQANGAESGGAAAAVAMVTVGTVMLVLGPAVIVLRALDERRQERRFLKLSGEEDLPPSYEQATGSIEQAPTYSSLNLDTILSNSSSSTSNNTALLR